MHPTATWGGPIRYIPRILANRRCQHATCIWVGESNNGSSDKNSKSELLVPLESRWGHYSGEKVVQVEIKSWTVWTAQANWFTTHFEWILWIWVVQRWFKYHVNAIVIQVSLLGTLEPVLHASPALFPRLSQLVQNGWWPGEHGQIVLGCKRQWRRYTGGSDVRSKWPRRCFRT